MAIIDHLTSGAQAQRIARGTVDAVVGDEPAAVRVVSEDGETVWCDLLATGAGMLRLAPGETVLLWHPGRTGERGVIVGRIGAPAADAAVEVPDELVIEAKQSLTLRVGDGSITIRDGKILIKGKDLVSHAQRTNRIRGGAVAIN